MRLHARGEELLLFGPRMAADISMLDPATQHLVTAARERISKAGRGHFEAPECAGSGGEGESDMWVVGALVFFLLSGRPPFAASSEAGAAAAHGDAADSADVCSPPCPPMSAAARHFLSRLLCRLPAQRATPNEALCNPWVESMCAQALDEDHPVASGAQQGVPLGGTRGGTSTGRARGGRRARVCFREVEETEGGKEEEEGRRGGASKAAYVEGWLAASGVRGGDDVEGGEGDARSGSDGGAHEGEHDGRGGGDDAHAAQGFGSPTARSEERTWQGGGGIGGMGTTQGGSDTGRGRDGVGGGEVVRAAPEVSFVLDECDFSAMLDRDHAPAVGNFATLPARLSRSRADAANIASASSPPLPGRTMPPLPSLSSDSRARSSALPPRHSPDCTGAGGRRQLLPSGSRSMPHDSSGRAGRAGSPEVSSDYAAALATASHRVERQLLSTLRAPRGSRSMVLTSTAPPPAASAVEGSGWQSVDFSEMVEPGPGGARSSGGAGEAVDVAQLVPLVQVGDHTVDNLLCDFDHLNATPPRPHPGSDAEPWPDGGSSSGRQWSAPSSDSGDLDLSAMDLNGPVDVGGAGGVPSGEGPLGTEQSMIVDALGRRLLKSPMASPHPRRKHGRSSHVFC
ncbi:unnamed protein product [Closterium sp. Yama58-4]|nr:unnamed protein product [Closterium sp. Yama58-4]